MLFIHLASIMIAAVQTPAAIPAPPSSAPAAGMSAESGAQVAQAFATGRQLYAYDRAAWVSTDAMTASIPADRLPQTGGYVIEPADAGALRVTYYAGSGTRGRAFFVADVRDDQVVDRTVLAKPVPLTPQQALLVRARTVAEREAAKRSYRSCTVPRFNAVTLPAGPDGSVAVYLLSPQAATATFPFGGNYRIRVGRDGRVADARAYSKACLNLGGATGPGGASVAAVGLSHLLDPVPTEIHVLGSLYLGLPTYVSTPDGRTWMVDATGITPSVAD